MMRKQLQTFSRKSGLPAGTLIHTGERSDQEPRITFIAYNQQDVLKEEFNAAEVTFPQPVTGKVTWIHVDGIHRIELIRQIGDTFNIHGLVLEDIVHTWQRPKLEDYEDYIYITMRILFRDEREDEIRETQLSIILLDGAVITFSEYGKKILEPVMERIRNAKGKIRAKKEDYLLYVILDTVVDGYFPILDELGEQIEDLEDEILDNPDQASLETLHTIKRNTAVVKRTIRPLREVINRFTRDDLSFIAEDNQKYFRDVYDHTIQLLEAVELLRDLAAGLHDIYISTVSYRLNEVMKILTVIATIFIPLTFIAGIYGMNFKYMPELTWKWGYFAIWGLMVALGAGMALYFKKKDWF